jgi:hypothetical protein
MALGFGIGIPFIRVSRGGGNTARTDAFLTATGITDATIISALNAMDTSLISAGLLPAGTGAGKIKALYPIVGGTAATHKFNFVNPLDTNAAFRLVFFGGWTHNASGMLGNATNTYADSFFQPTTNFASLNNKSFGCYVSNNQNGGWDMGAMSGGAVGDGLMSRNGNISLSYNSNQDPSNVASTNSIGWWCSSRLSALSGNLYKNTTSIITLSISVSQVGLNFLFGSRTIGGTPVNATGKNYQLLFLGDGLTSGENTSFYNAVISFNTTLGR